MAFRRKFIAYGLVLAALACPWPAFAQETLNASLITARDVAAMRMLVSNDLVRLSLETQNGRHAGLNADLIKAADDAWRKETESDLKPVISRTISNPLSSYLLARQAASGGLYAEIFLMDNKGLNAGISSITSDYWQGDEPKFQKTFDVSSDAVFIDEAEYDKETGTWRAQVSFTVTGGGTAPLGAATFEVNLTELARRRALGL